MSSIRNVLRHRATIRRAVTESVNGGSETSWITVGSIPCLLDTGGEHRPQPELSAAQQSTLDRTGVLFTTAGALLMPQDRLQFTRGAAGTFVVKPRLSRVATLTGTSHAEWRVEEVPS